LTNLNEEVGGTDNVKGTCGKVGHRPIAEGLCKEIQRTQDGNSYEKAF
jgi:hypothetical protein